MNLHFLVTQTPDLTYVLVCEPKTSHVTRTTHDFESGNLFFQIGT